MGTYMILIYDICILTLMIFWMVMVYQDDDDVGFWWNFGDLES